jgi:hypothetical protein
MNVRQAAYDDVEKFPRLFEKAYGNHSLYHVRTPEFYRYLLVKRPNVGLENIFVAERDTELVGFAAVGIKSLGTATIISIYEISATDLEAFHALVSRIHEVGKEKKCAYLETVAPPHGALAHQLAEAGFTRSKGMATMGYPISMGRILSLFVERALSKGKFNGNVKVVFDVQGESLSLTLPEGTLKNGTKGDFLIQISACRLLELLFKKTGLLTLVIKGKAAVTPWRRILSAREVIEYLAEDVTAITPYTELT